MIQKQLLHGDIDDQSLLNKETQLLFNEFTELASHEQKCFVQGAHTPAMQEILKDDGRDEKRQRDTIVLEYQHRKLNNRDM